MVGAPQAPITKGLGLSIPRTRLRLRNVGPGAIPRSTIAWMNFIGNSVTGLSMGAEPGEGDDEHSTVEPPTAFSTKTTYPMVVAEDDVAEGARGNFFLQHPNILLKCNQSSVGNNVSQGVPIIYDYLATADGAVRRWEQEADYPVMLAPAGLSGGGIRFLGWGLGTSAGTVADLARPDGSFIPCCFDGWTWILNSIGGTGVLA